MKPMTIYGLLLMLGGFVFMAGGGLILSDALDANERAAAQSQLADNQCRAQLARLGTVEESGMHLEVMVNGVRDPRQALGDATSAAAMCPNRTITAFCLGSGCGSSAARPGGPVNMTVRLTASQR